MPWAQTSLCEYFNASCKFGMFHLSAMSSLKWKAPSENSIDFKLELKFPPLAGRPNDPDFAAKPAFKLLAYYGDSRTASARREGRYEYFDLLDVSDEDWEQWVLILAKGCVCIQTNLTPQNEGHGSSV